MKATCSSYNSVINLFIIEIFILLIYIEIFFNMQRQNNLML